MAGATPHGSGHGLLRAFGWAFDGLFAAIRRERNLRIHLGAGVLAALFAALAPLEPVARALVYACIFAVIAAEAMNSAVEAVVDLASPAEHPLAKHAKDAAAGAVLAVAMGSVVVFAVLAAPHGPWLAARMEAEGLRFAAAAGSAVVAAVLTGVMPLVPQARARGFLLVATFGARPIMPYLLHLDGLVVVIVLVGIALGAAPAAKPGPA